MNKSDIKIVFMGTPEFASVCLDTLLEAKFNVVAVVSQPDKPVGRKHVITPPPTKVRALEAGIPVFQPDSMKTDESYEEIKKYSPDLIITAAYGKLLPERVLNIPTYGCINAHGSLLPKYRGASPVQMAILNGEAVTGVTVMKMDIGMDTGDMISKVEVPIDENIDTDGLMMELAKAGGELLVNTIEDYVNGKIAPVPQDEALSTHCSMIKPEDGIFNWNDDATTIHNKVRALKTWPGAQTSLDGKRVKVYETAIYRDGDFDAAPAGTVVKAHKGDLIVACGNGYLKILELQLEGGKRLKAIDCAHNYKVGTVFGN